MSSSCKLFLSFLLPNKNPIYFSPPYASHVLFISSFLILSLYLYLAKSTNHCAPNCATFLQLTVTSFPLCPNTDFSAISMNTFSHYSSINVIHKVSQSCTFKITDKIMVVCILILVFLDSKWEEKVSVLKGSRHTPDATNS